MRSNTQAIILDRLQHALESRGVSLKRTALLEVAAQSFGFLDGNAFVAAMKEGRYDPPVAQRTQEIEKLVHLYDPVANASFALAPEALCQDQRKDRFIVSPYGSLLALPEVLAREKPQPQKAWRPVEYVIGLDGTELSPEVAAWRNYLVDYIDVEIDPILYVEAKRIARIDGKLFFAFELEEEYENHEEAMMAMASFAEYGKKYAAGFERVGGFMRWIDHANASVIEFEAFLPVELAAKVDHPEDWHDAVSILMGSEHQAVMADFHPQAWQKDFAIDVDPEGETEIDITFEILTMGADAAGAIKDSSQEADLFTTAALAPYWIYDWKGPYNITVQDEIETYLRARASHPDHKGRSDDIWSCDNCGETAQDGSGICITCGHNDVHLDM